MDSDILQKILDNQHQMHREMKEVKNDTNTIKRAIYGDPDNLVSGLIHRQVDDENRLRKLETVKNKFLWMAAGFIVAFKIIEIVFFNT